MMLFQPQILVVEQRLFFFFFLGWPKGTMLGAETGQDVKPSTVPKTVKNENW